MKKKAVARPVQWSSWHICTLDEDNKWTRRPVAEELLGGSGDEPETAIQKMKLLETFGLPAAWASLVLEKADNRAPTILILKCKPSCWRLYLDVYEHAENEKRILYLLAVCKKADAQQAKHTKRARHLLSETSAGRIRIERFKFPG